MKKKWLFIMLSLVMTEMYPQTYQQTDIVLNSEIPKDRSMLYEASTSITLMDGFRCEPDKKNDVTFTIDRYGVYPPDSGIIGGPALSDKDGVVGALPGNLNVSDMGAAIYSIPLQLPQGLGKMTPEISIVYNSQSGNGMLGWCWDLSGLSSIVRTGKTFYHDGEKTSVNFTDDRFVMDGKRLMLCSGSYGGNGAVYKTEVDEMSKITSYTSGYNGPAKFKVQKKDGTVWEYGYTQNSRVETQSVSNVVLTWLVNKISDPDGNSIVFDYVKNQSTGESYINKIDYSLNENAGIQSMYRLSFEYADREDVESGFLYGGNVRKSKILKSVSVKNMSSGAVLYVYSFDYIEPGNYSTDHKFFYYRLSHVRLAANGVKLNSTRICWNKNSHYSNKFLSYSQDKTVFNKMIFAGDFNGDGVSDVMTVPYKTGNSYSDEVQAPVYINDATGSFYNEFYIFYFDTSLEWVYVVDFNGDGLDDVVAYYAKYENNSSWKSKIEAYLNLNGDFLYVGEYHSSNYFTIYPGDFLADEKAGFLLKYDNVNNSSGNPRFVHYTDGTITTQAIGGQLTSLRPERVVVEDIDADGHSEIMYLMNNNAIISKLSYENNAYVMREVYTDNNIDKEDFLFPGDFNGDGYIDFLKYDDVSYWKVLFSDGQRLRAPVSCLNNNLLRGLTLAPQDRYYCSLRNLSAPSVTIRTADFDGDGKTDVGVFKNSGGNHFMEIGFKICTMANGEFSFSDIKRFYLNINYSHQYVHVGNFLGHENASILGSVKSNPGSAEIPKIVSLNPHSSKFCVERITDGLGNSRGLRYKYLIPAETDAFYTYNYRWLGEGLRTVTIPFKALAADTVYSTQNKPCVTRYSYKNAMYHPKGHGLLGFEQSETKLQINGSVSETRVFEKDVEFMDNYCVALPKSCSIYNFSGQLIARESYEYEKYSCVQNAKTVMPLILNKRTIFYDFDIPNSVLKSKIESFDYQSDMSGYNYSDFVKLSASVLGVDDSYSGSNASACEYREETSYVYNDNPGAWIVARPQSIVYSKHYGDNEAVGSCEIFNYSGNNAYQVTKKTSLPNTNMNYADPLKIVAEYSYDNVGHAVTQSMTSPSAKSQRVTSLTYGEEYNRRYPTSTVNENGWVTYHAYDNNYGNLVSTVDYNHFETQCVSEPFETTVEKMLPDGIINVKVKRWAYGHKNAPQLAAYYYWEKTKGKAETMSFFSKNGKKLRDVSFNPNGKAVYVDMTYDDYGNMTSKSMPYIAGDDAMYYYYIYDNNNRLIEEVSPNGMVKNYNYNKLQTTINTVSPDGISSDVIETNNAMGWRVMTVDAGGNTINYEYYSDGKLKSAMIGDSPLTKVEYEYDNRRNLSKLKDPACDEMLYEYNAYGELLEMRTPKNCITTYSYDNMGNLIGRAESDEKGDNVVATQWIYDNDKGKIGTLSKIIYGSNHVVSYFYDEMLRITSVKERIRGTDYVTNYSYDDANREDYVTYSSDVTVQKKYSNSGYYMSMVNADDGTVLWQTEKTNALGSVTEFKVGNGLKTGLTYDDKTNFLRGIKTQNDQKVYQDLSYSYDGYGNLTGRIDLMGNNSETFAYDEFNRLVEIAKNQDVTGEMEYDNYGNILSKSADGKNVFCDAHYEGGSPYAVSRVSTGLNDLSGMNQSIEYTAFDKISKIQSGGNSYSISYGYDYERIYSKEIIDGKKKEKVYAGDCEYVKIDGKTVAYTYLKGPMGVFAVCCTDENGEKSIKYIHKDHLGSWCLITDENGKPIQKTSYDAWGNPRNDATWSGNYNGELLCDRGFTGHEHLSSFGVINMNGRAYDPMLSMMMSPDNIIQCPDMSQNYNRYSYCLNNPLSYSDPSGEWVEWVLFGIFNGVMNMIFEAPDIDDLGEGLLAFSAGFIQGCLSNGFSESAWIWQVVGNVAGSTLKTGVNNFIKQNDGSYDWDKIDMDDFKNDVMYTLGSSLASSVLSSYIVHPTETEQGVTFSSIICGSTLDQQIFETTVANVVGNVFTGKNLFEALGIKVSAGDIVRYVVPSVINYLDLYAEQLSQIDGAENMGWAYRMLLKINDLLPKDNRQMGVGENYSMCRSLFFKI